MIFLIHYIALLSCCFFWQICFTCLFCCVFMRVRTCSMFCSAALLLFLELITSDNNFSLWFSCFRRLRWICCLCDRQKVKTVWTKAKWGCFDVLLHMKTLVELFKRMLTTLKVPIYSQCHHHANNLFNVPLKEENVLEITRGWVNDNRIFDLTHES